MKTAFVVGALVIVAGCAKPSANPAEKQLFAYYDAQLNQIERETNDRINEPWPTARPEAVARAAAWAKRKGGGPPNCLNPMWAGKTNACGEDPVFCADVDTNRPADGWIFSPGARRCVRQWDGVEKTNPAGIDHKLLDRTGRKSEPLSEPELFCPPAGTATNCPPLS